MNNNIYDDQIFSETTGRLQNKVTVQQILDIMIGHRKITNLMKILVISMLHIIIDKIKMYK